MTDGYHLPINPRARLFSNRTQLLQYVPWTRGMVVAEIGVAYGGFSRIILDQLQPLSFHAIDLFNLHTYDTMWDDPIEDTLRGATHLDYYENRIPEAFTYRGSSWEVLETCDDDSLDFAYLDADHSYEAVTLDLAQLRRVIKPGGYLMLDDYTTYDPLMHEEYGVVRAVNEFLCANDWEIVGMSLEYNGFHNLLLKRPR